MIRRFLFPLAGLAGLVIWLVLRTGSTPQSPDAGREATGETRVAPSHSKAGSTTGSQPTEDPAFLAQEKELSSLVSSDRSIASKADQLMVRLPTLPPDLQELAAGHVAHLAEGTQMRQVVRLLSDRRVSERAQDILFASVYNQEPMAASGLMIQILEEGPEKYRAEAERTLSILLQADHGSNVAAWTKEWKSRQSTAIPKP